MGLGNNGKSLVPQNTSDVTGLGLCNIQCPRGNEKAIFQRRQRDKPRRINASEVEKVSFSTAHSDLVKAVAQIKVARTASCLGVPRSFLARVGGSRVTLAARTHFCHGGEKKGKTVEEVAV